MDKEEEKKKSFLEVMEYCSKTVFLIKDQEKEWTL